MIPVRRALVRIEARARAIREWISHRQGGALGAFYRAGGNNQLVSRLPLSSVDVVIDAGAYEGGWADEILCRYGSQMFLFEPIPEFSSRLKDRYRNNDHVEVVNAALGAEAGRAEISLQADGSSIHARSGASSSIFVDVVDIAAFLKSRVPSGAGCLKLNIEGSEYDVLERILSEGLARAIKVILIQFHEIAADSAARRLRIQTALSETHALQFEYPFVWECWGRRPEGLL